MGHPPDVQAEIHADIEAVRTSPNELIVSKCTLENVGTMTWPSDVTLRLVYHTPGLSYLPSTIDVCGPVAARGMLPVCFALTMPGACGRYVVKWRLQSLS